MTKKNELVKRIMGHKTASGHHKVEKTPENNLEGNGITPRHKTASGHHKVE